jgi:hypothetical protein
VSSLRHTTFIFLQKEWKKRRVAEYEHLYVLKFGLLRSRYDNTWTIDAQTDNFWCLHATVTNLNHDSLSSSEAQIKVKMRSWNKISAELPRYSKAICLVFVETWPVSSLRSARFSIS